MKSSKKKFKRVRPLLGTFVEIELQGCPEDDALNGAMTKAFDAVEQIDRLMSFHRVDSDLSRLNRAKQKEWISLDSHTVRVLKLSNTFFFASQGFFDIRCGGTLVKWDYLPSMVASETPALDSTLWDLAPVEIDGHWVCKTGPWLLDLGGIAKGYAVDYAVETLETGDVESGIVNAGGDLRVFGSGEWSISVREPNSPAKAKALFDLKRGAIATSGIYFSKKKFEQAWISPIVNCRSRTPYVENKSVTVVSETCVTADALTKVLALGPELSSDVLTRFRSKAFSTDENGIIRGIH